MIIKSVSDLKIEMIPLSQRGDYLCENCGSKLSVKYKITNPVNKKAKHLCNLCYMKLMATIEKVNKVLNDDFFDIPTFIHFGEIPESKKSAIHFHGVKVGQEDGLSVYHGVQINGHWHVVYPNPSNPNTNRTLEDFVGGQLSGAPNSDMKIYLVSGVIIGTGCDGEPIINRVRILEDISKDFIYQKEYDKAYEIAQQVSKEDPVRTNL